MARAFRAASGDLIWQPIGYPAAPTHPPYAIGTRGPLGDQTSLRLRIELGLNGPRVLASYSQVKNGAKRGVSKTPARVLSKKAAERHATRFGTLGLRADRRCHVVRASQLLIACCWEQRVHKTRPSFTLEFLT